MQIGIIALLESRERHHVTFDLTFRIHDCRSNEDVYSCMHRALLRNTFASVVKVKYPYCLPRNLIFSCCCYCCCCCCYCCCFQANEVSLKKSNFQERLRSSQGARIKFCVLLLLLAATRNLMASEGDPIHLDSRLECVRRPILKQEDVQGEEPVVD